MTKVYWNEEMTEEVRPSDATLNSIDFPHTKIYANVDGVAVRVRRVLSFEPVPEGESNNVRIVPYQEDNTHELIDALDGLLSDNGIYSHKLRIAVNEWMKSH